MTWYLAKTDPETYSLDDLEKEKRTVWDGVRNPQALRALRAMEKGDRVFIYHTGKDAAVVGLARVASGARPDPNDSRASVIDLEFAGRIDPPVTLAEIKASKLFSDWALVRQGRLSAMEAPASFAGWVKKLRPRSGI
jgi:predicted RNA-binding protein with PUA-like domain